METDRRRKLVSQQAPHARVGAVWLVLLLAGCRESRLRDCTDLLDAKRYAEAAKRCEHVYATEGDPSAGATAARAHYFLGNGDAVLAWSDRLVGTKSEAELHSLAAVVHQQRGEMELAEKKYRRALAGHQAAEDHVWAADTLYRLFYLCWTKSRYREALELASQAMAEAEAAGDRRSQQIAAQALHNVLYAVGDLEGAQRALEWEHRLADAADRAALARFHANRGGLLLDGRRFALARRELERALQTAAGDGDRLFFRSVHLNLVQLHLDLGDLDRAQEHLERAWQYAEPDGTVATSLRFYQARLDLARGRAEAAARGLTKALSEDPVPDWAWDLQCQLGRSREAAGDLREAERAYERSATIVEGMRQSVAFDELKAWLLDRKREPFEALFLLQARAGRAQDALGTAERVQARTFLDAFLNAVPAAQTAGPQPWSADRMVNRLKTLESLLPAMSKSPVASPRPLDRVLASFGDRHALVYTEAGRELWLIAVTGDRILLRRLAVPATEVDDLVARFLAKPDDAAAADRLGEILLPPGSMPPKGKTIHVIADGALGNLPFAAVRRNGRFLVEDHPVVLTPSLNALAAFREGTPEEYGPAVTLADPRGNLPAAASEAVAVAKFLGGTPRLSGRATSAELQQAARARILHLATHTGLGPRGPWLRLGDRDVTAAEIVTRRIGPRLVVLASCASAVRPGKQMWGSLSAAFLSAGSRTVLASLWSIEDAKAREFVLSFYAAGGFTDPAEALARVQRVAIRRGTSPIHWAPFVLQGSADPIRDKGDRYVVAMANDDSSLRLGLRHGLPGEYREGAGRRGRAVVRR